MSGRYQLSLPATCPHSINKAATSPQPTVGLIPLSVGPCSAASGLTRPASFPIITRLSRSMAASLPEKEPPAPCLSLSCLPRLLWDCCKVWLLVLQPCLPGRGGNVDQSAWRDEGKGSLCWRGTARSGHWNGACSASWALRGSWLPQHDMAYPMALRALYFLEPDTESPEGLDWADMKGLGMAWEDCLPLPAQSCNPLNYTTDQCCFQDPQCSWPKPAF